MLLQKSQKSNVTSPQNTSTDREMQLIFICCLYPGEKKVNEYSRSTSQDIIVTRCQTRMKNIYSSIKQQHRKMKTVYFNHIFHSKGRELNNHDNLCLSYKKNRKQENQRKEFFMEK